MALNFLTDNSLDDRREGTSTEYPYGTYRSIQGGVAGTGTPIRANELKEFDGFKQRILKAGKITPTGDPDTATNSQIFDALFATYGENIIVRPAAATPATTDDYGVVRLDANNARVDQSSTPGTTYTMSASLYKGGILYAGNRPGNDNTIFHAVSEYDVELSRLVVGGTSAPFYLQLVLPGSYTLDGIPFNSKLHYTNIRLIWSNRSQIIPIAIDYSQSLGAGESIVITGGKGIITDDDISSVVSAQLIVCYEQEQVD